MTKSPRGFTIVELLIVIVVIGVLATIAIVAYTGVRDRASNAQAISSIKAYVTALQMYRIDNGTYPNVKSCLGSGYQDGRCHSGDAGYVEDGGNLNSVLLEPYAGGQAPSPNTQNVAYSSSTNLAGAFYNYQNSSYNPAGGGVGFIQLGVSDCPAIGGTSHVAKVSLPGDKGVWCRSSID